jgi:hypothetical protein
MIMHQRQIALSLLFIMIWPVRGFTAPTDSGPFSIEQILSAPFPTALIAAPEGARFAWVSNRLGRRNAWLATRHATDSGYSARPLTRYTQDDGQEIRTTGRKSPISPSSDAKTHSYSSAAETSSTTISPLPIPLI